MKTKVLVISLVVALLFLNSCGMQVGVLQDEDHISEEDQLLLTSDLETIRTTVLAAKLTKGNVSGSMVTPEARKVWRDLPRTIELSRFIFTGTCTSGPDADGLYAFSLKTNYRGIETADIVYIDSSLVEPPRIGGIYLFFGSAYGNVMKDRVFYQALELIPQTEGTLKSVGIQDTADWTWERLIDKLPELTLAHPSENPSEIIGGFIQSSNQDIILSESEYVVDLRIQEILLELEDRAWYQCAVIHVEKGMISHKTIIMVAPRNAVSAGDECLAALSRADASNDIMYIVSSPKSLF